MKEQLRNDSTEPIANLFGLNGIGRYGPEYRSIIPEDDSEPPHQDSAGRDLWLVTHSDQSRLLTPKRFEGNKWCRDCGEIRMAPLYSRGWNGSSCVRCTRFAIVTVVRWLSVVFSDWRDRPHEIIVGYLIQLEVWSADGWDKILKPSAPFNTFAGLSWSETETQKNRLPVEMKNYKSRFHYSLHPANE